MTTQVPVQSSYLSGKIVMVTGAGAGIGAGIARRFSAAGADVVVCDLHQVEATCEYIVNTGRRAFPVTCDVSNPKQVTESFEKITREFGVPDALVNNAGIYPNASVLKMTPEEWDQTINIDLKSVFLCTQAAARLMIKAGKGGAIVNIGSIDATNPLADHSHYSAAKAGVIAFTKAAAQELGPHGIRVNSVSPGLINRPGLETAWPDGYNRFMRRTPLGRLGEPEDIADACIFLTGESARWITGTNLIVDGGVQACPLF